MTRASFFQCEDGVAAVEFAMIVPVLSLLLMGVVAYGMFINTKMQLQDLSRTAAQYVVQGGSDADVMANIIETSDFYIRAQAQGQTITLATEQQCECAGGISVSCTSSCPAGDYIRHYYITTLDGSYAPILPLPGFPNSIALQGYSRMQYNP